MERLTARELDVARLVADGLTHEEVGQRLGITARTAKAHTASLRRKLGVNHKREIGRALRQYGIR